MAYRLEKERDTVEASDAMEIRDLSFSYDGREKVLTHIDLCIPRGKITVLLGANGCGKTTLFRLMARNLSPDEGEILLGGVRIEELSRKEFARRAAIVHQSNTAPPDLCVETLVGYGRTPYLHAFQSAGSKSDCDAIRRAMELTGVLKHRKKMVSELSGGQRQRVWIAAALAQETELLMLDEPTSFLDIRYQIELLQLIRRLNRDYGVTIVMVLHDINQAIRYADEIVGMKDGRIMAQGLAEELVTPDFLRELYGIALPLTELSGQKFVLAV